MGKVSWVRTGTHAVTFKYGFEASTCTSMEYCNSQSSQKDFTLKH